MPVRKSENWITTTERFVVFLDIMGFKDLVSRIPHEDVYKLMSKLSVHQKFIKDLHKEVKKESYKNKELYTTSFSDSIILFSKDTSIESLDVISSAAAYIMVSAIEDGIPMKGAIACGKMSVNKTQQIYFGQPIIDAYLLQEEVNYYGVVAHNSIDSFFLSNKEEVAHIETFFNLKTPLKSGDIIHRNIDWFYLVGETKMPIEKRILLFDELLETLRSKTSGYPRKYIDNTKLVFERKFKIKS